MKSSKVNAYQSGNLILKQKQNQGALILGDCNSAMDKKIQKQFNIRTIISIGQQALPIKQKLPQNCKHHFYDIHDNKSQKVSAQLFDQICDLIQNSRKNGGTLVHCYAGVSRSSTFVISYIMKKFLKTYNQSKQIVKKARNCIYPNDAFVNHLKNYQKMLKNRQEERLKKIQQEKRLLIDKSLVKSARKSIRGGVKAADISPEKVKQINEAPKQIIKQIVQLVKINKQETKLVSKLNENKLTNKQKSITRKNENEHIEKNQSNKKNVLKKQLQKTNKNKNNQIQKEQQIKKISIKNTTIKNQNQRNKFDKNINSLNNIQKKQLQKQENNENNQQMKIQNQKNINEKQKIKLRKTLITKKSQNIDQSLLNQKQKHIKKIYQTKLNVK